jgi:hypothetical protein
MQPRKKLKFKEREREREAHRKKFLDVGSLAYFALKLLWRKASHSKDLI